MLRRLLVLSMCSGLIISLGGCATARKQKDMELQGLHNQVSTLEAQLQSKDEELSSCRDSLSRAGQESQEPASNIERSAKMIPEAKSRPTVKQIQVALKNAGYDPGSVDGKMGKQTRSAIKAFQKDNGLAADGKVGKRTWSLLSGNLNKKIK
jgi:murein L,D-transpeptidase YcbB/YkuD